MSLNKKSSLLFCAILIFLFCHCESLSLLELIKNKWQIFIEKYAVVYDTDECAYDMQIYINSLFTMFPEEWAVKSKWKYVFLKYFLKK